MIPECSVVVPLCNEEQNLPILHVRINTTLRRLAIPYEIIYVDDGSTDSTAEIILDLHKDDSKVKGIFLSRNFGHQAALCAGLEAATGRTVVTIDGDLQDPPELIPQMLDQWHQGYQVVFARRRRRKENPFRRATYYLFYRLLRRISDLPIPSDTGDFALMDRQAVEQLNNLPERTRFIRGLRTWVGFRQTAVEYDRELRYNGKSKYSLRRLFRLALDGIIAFSDLPLKTITLLGCVVSLLALGGFAVGALGLGASAIDSSALWLASGLGLLGGIQLISMGILGEYITRIHHEVRGRPLYVTRERIGFRSHPRPVPNVLEFLPNEQAEPQEKATGSRIAKDWAHTIEVSKKNT